MSELTIRDAKEVKAEVVDFIGSVLEDARVLSLNITDDETDSKALELGVRVKEKLKWLKGRRKEVYVPLKDATETVRLEYDNPIKLGEQIEETLAAARIKYKQKKAAEAERLRLAAEAEAKLKREEAERKEREAQAERDRIIRERELEEQRKRDAIAAEEKRKKDEEARVKAEADAKAKAESDARSKQLAEEQESRLKNAQEADDHGLAERSEQILETQKPVSPLPAPLPSASEIEDKAKKEREERAAAAAEEKRKADEKAADEKRREEDAARLRRMDEETAAAKASAAEAEAVASQQVIVKRPDEGMRTSVNWCYDIPNEAALKKLCLAIAQDRAPVEYLGFHNKDGVYEADRVRSAFVNKDVQRMKGEFQGEAIGIRTWPEEKGSFKA